MDQLSEAISLIQSQQFANAESILTRLLDTGETDTKIHQTLAESQLHQQKFSEAINTLESGLQIDPNQPELLVYLSQVYWGTGQKDKAIPFVEKALESNPRDIQTMSNLAAMYYELGRKDDALAVFDKILTFSPHSYQIHFNIGSIHIEETRYEEAIRALREGLNYDPNNSFGNKQLGMALHISGAIREGLNHYDIAYDNATDEAQKLETLILQGNAHRDLNQPNDARRYYQHALQIDPNNELVKTNLQSIAKRTIPSWHFTMLADTSRNEAYDKAISAAVQPGHHVLDIGTGSGLLSMIAARAGAKEITAVEMEKDLADVARLVIADNNYQDHITVYERRSTALVVGKEMKERADMVVSEILDAGLLGEAVLPSLRHAWANLLKKDAICIPKAADVKAVIIQSDDFKRVNPVGDIQGFDLSAFNHFREDATQFVQHSNEIKSVHLSEVFSVLSVDFYNLPKQATPENPNTHSLEVEITKEGCVHGVMFWFDLHVDEHIIMSSGPDGELVHWGQAIRMFEDEQEVQPGDVIRLVANQSETIITFDKV
ncbi:MAG: tetratricopeptide repeat protein [Fluviicola sp.]